MDGLIAELVYLYGAEARVAVSRDAWGPNDPRGPRVGVRLGTLADELGARDWRAPDGWSAVPHAWPGQGVLYNSSGGAVLVLEWE